MLKRTAKVSLVGAGPGDPDLLTLKALRCIEAADVILYDRLVSEEILALARPGVMRISVGKSPSNHPVPQESINELLVRLAQSGHDVVRLKGGDPLIFGRGSEEILELRRHGIEVVIVPGVTAAQGCAAATGIPLTHRGLATGVRYLTGHCRLDRELGFDWRGLADPETTLVVYMGLANIETIAAKLIAHGLPGSTPALAVSRGTTPRQRELLTILSSLSQDVLSAGFETPILFVIGRVASLAAAGRGRLAVDRPESLDAALA